MSPDMMNSILRNIAERATLIVMMSWGEQGEYERDWTACHERAIARAASAIFA